MSEFPEGGEWVLWENHGYEGWSPTRFDTIEAVVKHLMAGSVFGENVLTRYVAPSVLAVAIAQMEVE